MFVFFFFVRAGGLIDVLLCFLLLFFVVPWPFLTHGYVRIVGRQPCCCCCSSRERERGKLSQECQYVFQISHRFSRLWCVVGPKTQAFFLLSKRFSSTVFATRQLVSCCCSVVAATATAEGERGGIEMSTEKSSQGRPKLLGFPALFRFYFSHQAFRGGCYQLLYRTLFVDMCCIFSLDTHT